MTGGAVTGGALVVGAAAVIGAAADGAETVLRGATAFGRAAPLERTGRPAWDVAAAEVPATTGGTGAGAATRRGDVLVCPVAVCTCRAPAAVLVPAKATVAATEATPAPTTTPAVSTRTLRRMAP